MKLSDVLELYDVKYEADNVSVARMKRKPCIQQCEYCDKDIDVTKQKIDIRYTKAGASYKCTSCNLFKNPSTQKFEWTTEDYTLDYKKKISRSYAKKNKKD